MFNQFKARIEYVSLRFAAFARHSLRTINQWGASHWGGNAGRM